VALFRRDLPAFSALDGLPDPGRRFWARCVEGARILAVVAFQPAMNPDGNAVRQPVVETLRNDLETAVEAWVAQATPPLSGTETGPDRGLRAVAFRLAVAESILGALQSHQPAGDEGLRLVVERAVELQKKAQTLVTMADSVPGLAAELWSSSADARARSAAAFWQRYLELRSMAPSKAWQKLLDCQTIFFLCDALRERPPWAVEEGQAAAAYEVLKLIALIRDKSGPLPLDASWSEKADPFYKVFWRVLR